MASATSLPPEMADLLGRGGTIVTGNQRAARTLRLAFDRQSLAGGRSAWQPPLVFAWDTWVATLYRQLLLDGHASRVVLNRSQELHLWQSIISADPQWKSLHTSKSLADLAASAWQLLCAYRGGASLRNLGVSEDTRRFQRWAQVFLRRCQSDFYLSAAELEEALADAIVARKLARPAIEIRLVGFDHQTPAQKLLLTALRDSGVKITDAPDASGQGPAFLPAALHLVAAEDPATELRQAAVWLRFFLLRNPHLRVAVIVPDLPAERREIDRVFRQHLAPELQNIAIQNPTGPFEFSLGQPLASISLVSTALQILRLAAGALPISTVSHLLLSPYFTIGSSEASDDSARAEFDAFKLRRSRSLRPEITLERLIDLATDPKYSSRLARLLSQLRSLQRTAAKLFAAPAPMTLSAWAEEFRALLQSSGWASSRLASVEFQAHQKWESALDELASLDLLSPRCAYAEALASLEGILQRTLFAPESRDTPIQIMSPLEAAGSRFDAVWFLRASDLAWPSPPGTHPFLGWRLQQELAMPGSDPTLDTAHALRVTARLAASAATVIFSYASQTADSHQRPSALLSAFNLQPLNVAEEPLAPPAVALELLREATFIPLADRNVRGGADVLKLQAACGFRAFAEKRLRATPLEAPQPGMDARESGTVVHQALEHLWDDLRTHPALNALTPAERSVQLSRSIEHSLTRARALIASDPAATRWDDAYLELQRQRLHRLLGPWLEVELKRAPFEVVFREEKETVSIGPLTLEVRVDRVDRILDPPHGEVLIDYKTGNGEPKHWKTNRPDEPQVPLYAVLRSFSSATERTAGPVAAVAFARIRAGKDMALHGHQSRENLLVKIAKMDFDTLDQQIEDWRSVLTTLAQSFADGDTRVLPNKYPETCRFCPQLLLCRLDPASLLVDPDEEAPEEEFA